jgi:hypothetical protein
MLPGHPSNPLARIAFDYLIRKQTGAADETGRLLEVGSDVDEVPSVGLPLADCNLFDEKVSGRLRPYRRSGFRFVGGGNPNAYAFTDVLRTVAMVESCDLGVIAKKPGVMQEDSTSYVVLPKVFGINVEKNSGTPTEMDVLRRNARKPNLLVWFVSSGDGRGWAAQVAYDHVRPRRRHERHIFERGRKLRGRAASDRCTGYRILVLAVLSRRNQCPTIPQSRGKASISSIFCRRCCCNRH